MKNAIKLSALYNVVQPFRELLLLKRWLGTGKVVTPPQVVKRAILFSLARDRGIQVLVETGTYLGDTLACGLAAFREVHSIEVEPLIHARAVRIFGDRPGANLHLGDSGELLPEILSQLNEPAVFWLDGHFSGHITGRGNEDTPVEKELQAVLQSPFNHVAVIDDAREFGANPSYPTLAHMEAIKKQLRPDYAFFVVADLIVVAPVWTVS